MSGRFPRLLAPLLPLFRVLVPAAYTHAMMLIHLDYAFTTAADVALMIPFVLWEFGWKWPSLAAPGSTWDKRILASCFALLSTLFWLAAYVAWAVLAPIIADHEVELSWQFREIPAVLWIYMRAQWPPALAFLLADVALYWLFCVRRRFSPIVVVLLVPGLQVPLLMEDLYANGGRGHAEASDIRGQQDVEVLLDVEPFFGLKRPYPRDIFFDAERNSVIAGYGCTHCSREVGYGLPTILRFDLGSRTVRRADGAIATSVAWDRETSKLLFAPWYKRELHRLDATTLDDTTVDPLPSPLGWWTPTSLAQNGESVFITSSGVPALLQFDATRRTVSRILDFQEMGYVSPGGTLGPPKFDPVANRVWLVGGPGNQLFALDARNLAVVLARHLERLIGSSVALDVGRRRGYYLSHAETWIRVFDLDDFHEVGTLEGEPFAHVAVVDPARNRLYVPGFFSGTVFALDLETGRRVWTRAVGALPSGLWLDEGSDSLFVNSMLGMIRIHLAGGGGSTGEDGRPIEAANSSSRSR